LYDEFLKLKGALSDLSSRHTIISIKDQSSVVFQIQLHWYKQLSTLFAAQENLCNFCITMQKHQSNCIQTLFCEAGLFLTSQSW